MANEKSYGLRPGAQEFPLMIVISVIYPCNFGCPNCPYTEGNSEIRRFYREKKGEMISYNLWTKIADEAGPYGAWMRCTGGGEPMLHPRMTEMIEYSKQKGARVWLNTNGSMFHSTPKQDENLKRILKAGIDLIEFSMDAGDAVTYAQVRPPRGGSPKEPEAWWTGQVENVKRAIRYRNEFRAPTRIVVSIIRQSVLDGKLDSAVKFWLDEVGVDEVITRKFLTWDDNTTISNEEALDPNLYAGEKTAYEKPCVWPFERLNVDTLGRVSLCGQDISFKTSKLFPSVQESSIREIWRGERFDWYRRKHLEGKGSECWPCRGCSAWSAGIRDWEYGWLQVLKSSGDHLKEVMRKDFGAEVEIFEPAV